MTELPPWRSPLARALHRNRSLAHLRFVQLATVDSSGCPHNRTVVFRGLCDTDHGLTFITDERSEKIKHLQHQPQVEVCWYFTKTREQFRFSGPMHIIDARVPSEQNQRAQMRLETWQRLSENARQQFYWPNPGAARSPETEFQAVADTSQPANSFVLLKLKAIRVEHLELRGNPQNRTRFTQQSDQNWRIENLNP